VSAGSFTFEVLEMEGRRVKSIRLHQARAEEAAKKG
jgi:CBS domain containing-hemolysin-like protein